MEFGHRQPLYVPERSDTTSPRILVQYVIYHPHSHQHVKRRAWEAASPQGVVDNGPGFIRNILGYAEFPPNTQVGRFDDFEEFVSFVERNARYVHWKDQSSDVSVTGDPFNAAQVEDK